MFGFFAAKALASNLGRDIILYAVRKLRESVVVTLVWGLS